MIKHNRQIVPALAVSLFGVAPLVATNLLQNPDFTASLAGWVTPSYSAAEWSSVGRSAAGSALVTSAIGRAIDAPNAPIQQCVAVQAGHSYAFGASLYAPGSAAPGANITEYLDVRFYPGASCTGEQLAQFNKGPELPLRDTWADVQWHGTAPVGAVSAMASFGALDSAGSAAAEVIQVFVDDTYFFSDANCANTAGHLCLTDGRFLVYGSWAVPSQGRSGYIQAVPITSDSGLFWFFSEENLELFVKVLNACVDPFHRYWVFASGLTNVQVALVVYDTFNDQRWDYSTAAGAPFPPIQDTNAFATCP